MKLVYLLMLLILMMQGCAGISSYNASTNCLDYENTDERESCHLLNIRYSVAQKLSTDPYISYLSYTSFDERPYFRRYDLVIEAMLNEFGQVSDVKVLEHSGDTYAQELIEQAIIEESPFIPLEDNRSIGSIVYGCRKGWVNCEIDAKYVLFSTSE